MCILFIVSAFIDPETCPWVCYLIFSGPYPSQAYIFSSPAGLWKVVARVPVFEISHVIINAFIGFKENNHKFFKFVAMLISVVPRGTQSHLVKIPRKCFVSDLKLFKKNYLSSIVYVLLIYSVLKIRVGPRGTKVQWVNLLQIFLFCLNTVGDIFLLVMYLFVFIVGQRGTMAHWVNPLPIFKLN